MNNTPAIFFAAILSAAISGGVVYFFMDPQAAPPPVQATADPGEVARLEDQIEALQAQIAALPSTPMQSRSVAGPSAEDLDARIAAALAKALEEHMAGAGAVDASANGKVNLAALAAGFTFDDFSPGAQIWRNAIEGGYMDELIAEFQARADAAPNDPDAQVALGAALIAKLNNDDNSQMEVAALASRADRAFLEALDINPQHWEARFSRAVSLSFWPPMLGKGAEAISEFQTVITQQEAGPVQDGQDAPYLYLGNMYQQQGEHEKAMEAWKRGAARHPNSKELQQKLNQ